MAETYHKLHRYHGEPIERQDAVIEESDQVVVADSNPAITKAQLVVQYIVGVVVSILALRFLLALFGANETNNFVELIYSVTAPLVAPFRGLFNITASSGVARFEVEAIVAMLIYALVGVGIIRLMDIFRRSR